MTTIQDGFIKITSTYVDRFVKDKDSTINLICKATTPSLIIGDIYKMLIKDNSMQPITELSEQEKEEVFSLYKKSGMRHSKEKQIEICKAIYTICFLSKNI